ncbi:MAG: Redoxin domain protein [Mucilaginibacter sp.]|nr:Redoxin domain protein [Mucilaginibacter sp.]
MRATDPIKPLIPFHMCYQKIFKIALLLMIILTSLPTEAQTEKPATVELKIGDTLPALLIRDFLPARSKSIPAADLYHEGLLIINFWATWCIPCQAELSRLDSLQDKFRGQLHVLSVAYEDSVKVRKFLQSRPDIHTSNLMMITDDKILIKWFKHRFVPHNVWIDSKGVIKAITNGEEINAENIASFLKQSTLSVEVKKDNLNFHWDQPFHLGDSSFAYRSIITPYIDGIGGGDISWGNHRSGMTRYFGFNKAIVDLFWVAFTGNPEYYAVDYRLVKILTKDSIKFFRPAIHGDQPSPTRFKRHKDWDSKYTFCYDLTMPKTPDSLFYAYVQSDLERYFHITCLREYQQMACNVISKSKGKYSLAAYRTTSDSVSTVAIKDHALIISHATVRDLMNKILSTFNSKDNLWLDESGIHFPINLTIPLDRESPVTMTEIRKKLAAYGLRVSQEKRPYPIMVLKDKAI